MQVLGFSSMRIRYGAVPYVETVPFRTGKLSLLEGDVSGWGGWIRTNTVCINSAASYQLDHAPIPLEL